MDGVAWIGRMGMVGMALFLEGRPLFVSRSRADGAVVIPIEGAPSMRAPMQGWLQACGRHGRAGLLAGGLIGLREMVVAMRAW